MAAIGGRFFVDAPQFTPARFGLLSVAQQPVETDPKARLGVRTIPMPCGPARAIGGAVCPPATGFSKPEENDRGLTVMAADPFTLLGVSVCSAQQDPAEARTRAEQALVRGEGRGVETVFWTGATEDGQTIHPHLAENTAEDAFEGGWLAATVVAGGSAAVSVKAGLSALEGALGKCYGGQGVLHVPRLVAPYLGEGEIARVGTGAAEHLESIAGSKVALGAGYANTSPAGAPAAAGTAWVYATGAVAIRSTGIELVGTGDAEWLDRRTNDRTVIVERTYTVIWDCCLFAARVALP